ncbi:hypothetical protein LDENG_00101660 [Lucifuga dentata]|nr:hypothetical protein LDENG_00101660 [Lucifuga dentata]
MLVTFFFSLSVLTDVALSLLLIQQSPKNLLRNLEQAEALLDCYHGDNNYPLMFWYQRSQTAMDLIGTLHYERASMEKNFEGRFNITGHSKGKGQLRISKIKLADSAAYFCAASLHSDAVCPSPSQKAKDP